MLGALPGQVALREATLRSAKGLCSSYHLMLLAMPESVIQDDLMIRSEAKIMEWHFLQFQNFFFLFFFLKVR